MAYSHLTENEMRVVYEARAQSRGEAAELERLKQELRDAYLLNENGCLNEFNRRWPQIYSETMRRDPTYKWISSGINGISNPVQERKPPR